MILRDLHIRLRRPSRNARLAFGQSTKKKHLAYFNLVFSILAPYSTPGLVPYVKQWVDKKTKQTYTSISFVTMQLPAFNSLHSLFYKRFTDKGKIRYIKVIPGNIQDLLSPEGLAHWIMGDGSLQNKGLHLRIYAFTMADLLTSALTNKWNLKCTVHMTKSGPRIYIHGRSMGIVRNLVKQHMDVLMYYKIGL